MSKTRRIAAAAIVSIPLFAHATPRDQATAGGVADEPRAEHMIAGLESLLGGSIVRGEPMACAGCGDAAPIAVGLHAHVGMLVRPRFAITAVFSAGSTARRFGDAMATLDELGAGLGLQAWATPRLYVRTAMLASCMWSAERLDRRTSIQTNLGGGVSTQLVVGYELIGSRSFTIDAQARLIVARYSAADATVSHAGAGIAFSWH